MGIEEFHEQPHHWPGGRPVDPSPPEVESAAATEATAITPVAPDTATSHVDFDDESITEDSEPAVVLEWFKRHQKEIAAVGTVATIAAGWILKKKMSGIKTPEGDDVFIDANVAHFPNTVSIGVRAVHGLAAAIPKNRKSERKLRQDAKDEEIKKLDPVNKQLFAMLGKKGVVHPLERDKDAAPYEEAVGVFAGILEKALLAMQKRHDGNK